VTTVKIKVIKNDVDRLRLCENSIALGNHVTSALRRRDVPVMGGIVPWFRPGLDGSITYSFLADGSIEVTASYTEEEDDEL
jgi:hypothetical protein